MAFVPGHKHDLFLSYDHAEWDWVTAFSRAIVSPSYHTSDWCREERNLLLHHCGGWEGLKVESFYRFLKIVKTPGPGNAHVNLANKVQHIGFFKEADGYEHPAGSPEFDAAVRDSARAIRELFQLMANRRQAVYVAPGPIGMAPDRQALENHLSDYAFNVKPAVLLSADYGPDPVRQEMEPCSAVIFLLGGDYDEFTEEQMKVARDLGRRMVFWVRSDLFESANSRQKALIERLRGSRDLPAGSQELGGASIQSMVIQLKDLLARQPAENETPAPAGQARVYLIYDSTLAPDSQAAVRIGDMLRDRGLEVLNRERDEDHEKWMRSCNGALLFRGSAPNPDWWLRFHLEDLRYCRHKLEAKAALVADPAQIATPGDVALLPYSDPLPPAALDPFLHKLLKARSADASR